MGNSMKWVTARALRELVLAVCYHVVNRGIE
jgi:hypothetical protein